MNEPKETVIPQYAQTEAETGGMPPGGPPDETLGSADNTTADSVEAAKEAAEMKRTRG